MLNVTARLLRLVLDMLGGLDGEIMDGQITN